MTEDKLNSRPDSGNLAVRPSSSSDLKLPSLTKSRSQQVPHSSTFTYLLQDDSQLDIVKSPSSVTQNSHVPVSHRPASADSGGKKKTVNFEDGKKRTKKMQDNPFVLPTKEEYLDEMKESKEKEKKASRKVHEKTTATFRHGSTRLKFDDLEIEPLQLESQNTTNGVLSFINNNFEPESPTHAHIMAKTLKYHTTKESENLNDFITKKREMFLLEYSLSVKREEIKKLDEIAREREEAIRNAEKALEEDAARFDAFLKDNNMKTMEALRRADAETKIKLEKGQEIKRLTNEIASIKNENAKLDEQLEDCRKYKEFLESLTPAEWFQEVGKKRGTRSVHYDDEEEFPMYFADPQQLLDIFKQLEENNMFLIQNSQETERVLEELRQKRKETEEKMDAEISSLKSQIRVLQENIKREEAKAVALKDRAKNADPEDQDIKLEELTGKVLEVYTRCIGSNDANISALSMLAKVEKKLDELFESIEVLPKEYVQQAEKNKEKERRQRLRAEKLESQQKAQEKRIQKALARSNAVITKRTGKPVMFRSELPKQKKEETETAETTQNQTEEEDYDFFFS